MTTVVTVATVATGEFPVEVQSIAHGGTPVVRTVTEIGPHSVATFHVTQTEHLRIFEQPLPVVLPEPGPMTDGLVLPPVDGDEVAGD